MRFRDWPVTEPWAHPHRCRPVTGDGGQDGLEAVSEPDAGQVRDELRQLGLRYVSDGIRGIMRRVPATASAIARRTGRW